ncbi:LamG domain-containing protein [Mesorhizobium sp. WSM3626]|uniref:LamG domain-containing protein n=1 Tax=Mesorhizobium sp. WSM3626 TaxID=1040987 RepID=UPI0018DDA39B|nr:LamG domain-containing protein [Mesorhizobium sp. WSM3626]
MLKLYLGAVEIWGAGGGPLTLAADAGSYTLTGTAATLRRALKTAAAAGSFTLTGSSATLRRALLLAGTSGSYTLTGSAAGLVPSSADKVLAADAGSFTLTGTAATLRRALLVSTAAGSYTMTGTAAGLVYGKKVAAAAGSFALTGTAAGLLRGYKVAAVAGSYAMSGTAATLTKAAVSDPNFATRKLLLGFEGVDAATATSDESGAAHGSATFAGNAQLDTAQSKFGGSSLLLDGNGDYITFPDSADWFFGTGQFTVEGFFRFAAAPTNALLVGQWSGGWAFWFNAGKLSFRTFSTTDSGLYTWSPTLNTWYHIAVDRDASNVLRIYVDGVMQVKTTGYTVSIPNAAAVLALGSLRPGGFTTFDMNGWIDEVRISNIATYGSDAGFTLPTSAFPRS